MPHWEVVILDRTLNRGLPVSRVNPLPLPAGLKSREIDTFEEGLKRRDMLIKCGRLSIEVDEDEIMPDRSTHLHESKLALLEAFRFMHTFAS